MRKGSGLKTLSWSPTTNDASYAIGAGCQYRIDWYSYLGLWEVRTWKTGHRREKRSPVRFCGVEVSLGSFPSQSLAEEAAELHHSNPALYSAAFSSPWT